MLPLILLIIVNNVAAKECALYLAPSTVAGAGRGIMAGIPYANGVPIEETTTLSFKDSDCSSCQLGNYAYATDDGDFNMIMFGAGVLYNHMIPKNVEYHWATHEVVDPSEPYPEPYSRFSNIIFKTVRDVEAGEELFVNYGDSWLLDRDIAEGESSEPIAPIADKEGIDSGSNRVSLDDLEQYGHCLSDVRVDESQIAWAGRGLFAKRDFSAGEVVVIAPLLTLSRKVVDATAETSVLMNYCFTVADNASEVVLFPLNNAAAINHQPDGLANLQYHWYDWNSRSSKGSYFEHLNSNSLSLIHKLAQDPQELFESHFAQFDIAFTAVRDITEGEELTFNYGDSWAEAWNAYGSAMHNWQEAYFAAEEAAAKEDEGEPFEYDYDSLPSLRAYIEVPEGFFPDHWLRPSDKGDDDDSWQDEL